MRKILIVEDEKMIRYGIYVMIEESGVSCREITECRNGKEALGFLEKDRYRQRWSVSFISFNIERVLSEDPSSTKINSNSSSDISSITLHMA